MVHKGGEGVSGFVVHGKKKKEKKKNGEGKGKREKDKREKGMMMKKKMMMMWATPNSIMGQNPPQPHLTIKRFQNPPISKHVQKIKSFDSLLPSPILSPFHFFNFMYLFQPKSLSPPFLIPPLFISLEAHFFQPHFLAPNSPIIIVL